MAVDILSSNVSLNRVIGYLQEPDTDKWTVLRHKDQSNSRIGFENASFGWEAGNVEGVESFTLGPLNFDFPLNKLSIVAGSVGAGKSTLLMSLLGETRLLHGKVFLPTPLFRSELLSHQMMDSVAYCAQTPYLLSDSVKSNILFGLTYQKERYRQALAACALLPDLEAFDAGDETLVGERGVS